MLWLLVPRKFRLLVYQGLLLLGLHLYGPTSSTSCFRLPFGLYAKTGRSVKYSEAQALSLVSRTSAKTPVLIDAIDTSKGQFIVMTRIPGKPIFGQLNVMTTKEMSLLASDLKRSFDQIRAVKPPDNVKISSVTGGSFICYSISPDPIGPFTNEIEFYRYLTGRCHLSEQPRLRKLAYKVHTTSHSLCLAHNDVTPSNILIDSRNRLAGIVDWECAAWMPEYWDCTRSRYQKETYPAWLDLMNEVFGAREEELKVEVELWKFSDPW